MIPFVIPMIAGGEVLEKMQSLPAMTSDTAPSGHRARASTTLNSNTRAYRAFNGRLAAPNSYDGWSSDDMPSTSSPQWVQRQTPEAIKLWAYEIAIPDVGGGAIPQDWTFMGSDNGTAWIALHEVIGFAPQPYSVVRFEIPSARRFRYFYHRLSVTKASFAWEAGVAIPELRFLQAK